MDKIVFYPAAVLRKPLAECRLSGAPLKDLIARLDHVMRREKHGIGIAAPQIGVAERVAIVDVSSRDAEAKRMVLINPVILETSDPQIGREGCMSVPDYTALVKRFRSIKFSYTNENGERITKKCSGIEAVCVQHEMDHLDGKLLIDRVACLKTDLLPRR